MFVSMPLQNQYQDSMLTLMELYSTLYRPVVALWEDVLLISRQLN